MQDQKLALILKFVAIANKSIKVANIQPFPIRQPNFFEYMGISVEDFFGHAHFFPLSDIQDAINCVESDQWDQSEFIMSCEGFTKGYPRCTY